MRYPVLLSRPRRDTWDPLPSPGSDGGTQLLSSARTAALPPQGASPRGPGTLTHVWPRDWRLTPADSAFAWGCGALASLLLMPGGGPGGQRRSEDARRLLPCRRPGVLRGGLAPPKAARPDPRSQSGKVSFAASEARVPRSLTLGGGKTRVSSEVGRQGGRSPTAPGGPAAGLGRPRRPTRPRLRGGLDTAHRTAGAQGIRVPSPRALPAAAASPLSLPRGSVRSGTSSSGGH